MCKKLGVVIAAVVALATSQFAKAEPALQLDIVGGTYVGGSAETTFTSDTQFQLRHCWIRPMVMLPTVVIRSTFRWRSFRRRLRRSAVVVSSSTGRPSTSR